MTEALRACPWCDTVPNMTDNLATDSGSKAQIGKWAWIECDCGARSPDVRANWGSLPDWQQDAADAWNRRARVALPSREEVARVLCKTVRGSSAACPCANTAEPCRAPVDTLVGEFGTYRVSADAILNLMRERMG